MALPTICFIISDLIFSDRLGKTGCLANIGTALMQKQGVLQGSIDNTLHFLIYIEGLPNNLDSENNLLKIFSSSVINDINQHEST